MFCYIQILLFENIIYSLPQEQLKDFPSLTPISPGAGHAVVGNTKTPWSGYLNPQCVHWGNTIRSHRGSFISYYSLSSVHY